MWRTILLLVLAATVFAAGLGTAGVRIAQGQQVDHRVRICHKVEGNGNTGNGYDLITVDKDSIVNKDGQIVPNGHGTHEGDAIPAFPAGSSGSHEWGAFAGQGNPEIIDNNCAPVTTTTTSTTEPTTTTTTTTTTSTTTTTGTTTTTPTTTTGTTTTEPTTTTTTTAPMTTMTETTTGQTQTTTTATETSPPSKPPKPKKPKPPMHVIPPPKSAPPGAPPTCPPGKHFDGRCGVTGNG